VFQVEYVHRHQGRVQTSAHEKVTRPRREDAEAMLFLNSIALNETRPCFHNRKDASDVVLSVDYDESFVVSLVVWILLVLYVLGASAGAFIYVVVKKAKARRSDRERERRGEVDVPRQHDIEDDEHDENVCEEDPIFLIYDYGTFDPRAVKKSPRLAHDWT
jgi:hypothetical protein